MKTKTETASRCRGCRIGIDPEALQAGYCIACLPGKIRMPETCKSCWRETHNAGGHCTKCINRAEQEWRDAA